MFVQHNREVDQPCDRRNTRNDGEECVRLTHLVTPVGVDGM
jgi:hypothetical protein